MEEMKEPNLREKFASLSMKAKMGINLRDEIRELLASLSFHNTDVPRVEINTGKEYKAFLSTLCDTSLLYALLSEQIEDKTQKQRWRLPLLIERIVEVLESSDNDHIFHGDIEKAVIFVLTPTSDEEAENKYLEPVAIKLFPDSDSISAFPFSFFIPCNSNEKKKKRILSNLGKHLKNSSDFYSINDPTWLIKILDTKGSIFNFFGEGRRFPFFSSFSIPSIPKALGIIDMERKDEFSVLSMSYSRLSMTKDEEVLENITLNREEGIIRLEHNSNALDFIITMKDKKSFLNTLFSKTNVYSFYPQCIDKKEEEDIDETQPYYKTRYSLHYKTIYGRKEKFNGFFTSYDLPKGWEEISDELQSNIDYADKMESTDISLIDIGRTNSDTVFVCGVVFSDYSKEYLYIAPDGTYYPGMKVMVPAGTKNTIQIVTIKSLYAFSKEKDAETIKKCKRIISHYPNKNVN